MRTQQITQEELSAYYEFALEHGIVVEGAQGVDNGNVLAGEVVNKNLDITKQTLVDALDLVKDKLVYKSPAQANYDRIAATNPVAAERLIQMYPGLLSQEPDQKFHNMAELLLELQGRDVNVTNIEAAIGRNQAPASRFDTRKRQPLYFGASKPTVNPKSHSATDDHQPFFSDSNLPLWKRKKLERERSEAVNHQQPQSELSASDQAFKGSAEALKGVGNTHSERDQTTSKFNELVGLGLGWRKVFSEMKSFVTRLEKRRAANLFVR